MHEAANSAAFQWTFLAAQTLVTLFILLHDWIPLGSLNNFAAKRDEDPLSKRLFDTLLGAVPAAIGVWLSWRAFGRPLPHGTAIYLWVVYGIFLLGLLRAWWIPYLLTPDPERAARYKLIFAGTHGFLPERNGLAPDTLHTLFHACVAGTVVLLCFR
jgi:hypothetical protein